MKAWVTYQNMVVVEQDEWESELDREYWDYGIEVEILTVISPSTTAKKFAKAYKHGLFLVCYGEQVQAFDGQFISFLNPNTKELN